jgi:dihydrofolate synthase/folylpolyglutamate synthase
MMTYEQCVSELYNTPLFGEKTSLDSLSEFLEVINNPHESLQFIHVAGTNGKGSICAMLASIYQSAGYKVGLFTSPHLISVNERIRINNVNISDDDLVNTYEFLQKLLANQTMDHPINPTFFEGLH